MRISILLFSAVLAAGCSNDPIACFDHENNGGLVRFISACSENTESYFWEFGDGNESRERDPEHEYTAPGSYEVTLTVSDEDEDTDRVTHIVAINEHCVKCECGSPSSPEYNVSEFCGTESRAENRETSFRNSCVLDDVECVQ